MRNLYVDQNTHDIILENNNIRMTETTTEWLACKLDAVLKTFFGEWFVNNEIGIPYFEEILKKQADLDNVQVIFSDAIKNTTGVDELLSFSIEYDNNTREYGYTFTVLASDDSTVDVEGTL